jgi:hypothetical protein
MRLYRRISPNPRLIYPFHNPLSAVRDSLFNVDIVTLLLLILLLLLLRVRNAYRLWAETFKEQATYKTSSGYYDVFERRGGKFWSGQGPVAALVNAIMKFRVV